MGLRFSHLRRCLGPDSDYVSRVLRSLGQQGLVLVRMNADNRGARWVYLTDAGLAERAELDRRSDAQALRILEPCRSPARAGSTCSSGSSMSARGRC
jgi:DNA-binding MarR family transcriptional regulator